MLKSKATGFKPKARPRPNANPTPSSSAKPSVERQIETSAPESQSATVPGVETTESNEVPRPVAAAEVVAVPEVSIPQPPAAAVDESIQPDATIPTSRDSISATTPVVSQHSSTSTTSNIPSTTHATTSSTTTATPSEPPAPRNTDTERGDTSARPIFSARSAETSLASSTLHTNNDSTQTAHSSSRTATEPSTSQGAIDVEALKRTQRVRAKKAIAKSNPSNQEESSQSSRPAKRRRVTNAEQDDVLPTIEEETPESEPACKRRLKPRDPNAPKRKRRASTPEDAAEQVVDHATTKMADLTKDLHIGRVFSMREKILEREAERQEKARLAREKELAEDSERSDFEEEDRENAENDENGTPAVPTPSPSPYPLVVAASSGPQLRLVNGVIVLDEGSLQVDRHRLAIEGAEELATIEEDDFTRIVTAGTNQKREKNTRWGFYETEKFYEGLKMFGTDFEMIAKMFGKKRSRRQIKLKFNKEEIEDPERINAVIMGRDKKAMDLSKVRHSDKLEDTDSIKAEIAALEKAYEDQEIRQAEAVAEVERQKRADIIAGESQGVGAGGTESAKENEANANKGSSGIGAPQKHKKKQTKKSKRQQQQHLGGEELEVLGLVEAEVLHRV